tara:strand:+ start:1559 stop:2017 length:459 start_codon:yes stop_codon:yes gene_type:complete
MSEHWIIRIGNGNHFVNSSKYNIWGINSNDKTNTNKFIREVKKNDILWFITSKSKGNAIAVSVFTELKNRLLGPLIDLTMNNKELGWTDHDGEWDMEIHYTNLYNISSLNILTRIRSPRTYRRFSDNLDRIPINLVKEYENIIKYSKITTKM